MPVSATLGPSDLVEIESQDRPLSAVALARRDILSDIPESGSDASSDTGDTARFPFDHNSAGLILQMIRNSAHEILASTGGQSPNPSTSVASDMAGDAFQIQNISRISDDIARNVARILHLQVAKDEVTKVTEINDTSDLEMDDVTPPDPESTPSTLFSPGFLRSRRPTLKSRGSRLTCRDCQRIVTPKWRPGPHGPATLCNVCGLLYAKRMGIVEGLHTG